MYTFVLTLMSSMLLLLQQQRNGIYEMTYSTLEQALKTKSAVIISTESYEHKGETRTAIKARKSNGKKVFRVVQYVSGRFSEAV